MKQANLPFDNKETRRERIKRFAAIREANLGPTLNAMADDDLKAVCAEAFPDWPMVFGMRFHPDKARCDPVLRRLLLACLEDSTLTETH